MERRNGPWSEGLLRREHEFASSPEEKLPPTIIDQEQALVRKLVKEFMGLGFKLDDPDFVVEEQRQETCRVRERALAKSLLEQVRVTIGVMAEQLNTGDNLRKVVTESKGQFFHDSYGRRSWLQFCNALEAKDAKGILESLASLLADAKQDIVANVNIPAPTPSRFRG